MSLHHHSAIQARPSLSIQVEWRLAAFSTWFNKSRMVNGRWTEVIQFATQLLTELTVLPLVGCIVETIDIGLTSSSGNHRRMVLSLMNGGSKWLLTVACSDLPSAIARASLETLIDNIYYVVQYNAHLFAEGRASQVWLYRVPTAVVKLSKLL
jgi:hypothetical protein